MLGVASELGEERLPGLRAQGASMDWDEAVSFALAKATEVCQALDCSGAGGILLL